MNGSDTPWMLLAIAIKELGLPLVVHALNRVEDDDINLYSLEELAQRIQDIPDVDVDAAIEAGRQKSRDRIR
jgi:hemolysin activation/secretion protein